VPKYLLQCVRCDERPGEGFHPRCPSCDGLTEPLYDLDKASLRDSNDPYERFFDLLPIRDRSLLPYGQSYTPLLHARRLGARIGLANLYLKNETVHPSGTTKYRMASVALAYLYENGVRHFCTSSTGNSSSAYARVIRQFPEMKMTLVTAAEFEGRVNYPDNARVEHRVLEDSSFAEAFLHAARFAREQGLVAERGFFNPGRREGLKMAWCESTDQLNQPIDWYVQAVSSGMGVYGTYKAAQELKQLGHIERLPALLCVQQASCAPMVRAWQEGAEAITSRHIVKRPQGIAKAIMRGDPSGAYPYMREIVDQSEGAFCAVSEAEIRKARTQVAELEGIAICFSAAAAVAGITKQRLDGRIGDKDTILVNLTGRDRESGE
jgi:threonine synthase